MTIAKPKAQIKFPKMEEEVLKYWKEHNIFERSVSEKDPSNIWSFYDGPPFATGKPHHGHLLAGTIKDVIPRYWAMQGKRVKRRFGWDCHGLPIEFETEKRLELKGRQDILDFGIERFNEECRSIVGRYTQEWEKTVTRMGRWVDFENDYKTMDLSFMESVWHVFKTLWEKGLIYQGKKVLPYSPRITTPLSNFEANLNYQDVQDPAVTVKLRLVDDPNTSLLVWTTTPWTLPANHAAAVHPDIIYAKVKEAKSEQVYILAKHQIKHVFGKNKVELLEAFKGMDLVGKTYQQMIPAFEGQTTSKMFQVYAADYITQDSGTGIVHLAPYGEEDFQVFQKAGIDPLEHVNDEGYFTEDASVAEGKYFKDADKDVIAYLKEKNLLFKQETIQHSYPFCYRTDMPLMYKPVSTWFVKVTAVKDALIQNNQQVHWVPEHLKDGRFGKWLENANDWAISRNRFWGNPIPIWRNEETGETLCVGSRAELEALSGQKVDDLHKHMIDGIEIISPKTGDTLKRIPEILDCWFESGSMPYAQEHYPFSTDQEAFGKSFPADFIAEGLDQTRGWFYTLMVLSTALDKGPAFKNVVVNGIVLAEDGRKMSKRLQNYPDPVEVLDEFGADTLRIYLLQSGAVRGDDLRFSQEGLKEMTRKVLLPFYNAYAFFATYASVDKWEAEEGESVSQSEHVLDQWILLKLDALNRSIQSEMNQYHLSSVVLPFLAFIDDLTNWYIRRSRRRFWKSENDTDKAHAYRTLYGVLTDFCVLAAPFIPFISEHVFQLLSQSAAPLDMKDSVHLKEYPRVEDLNPEQEKLMRAMDMIRDAVKIGRELREKEKIKNRQPLSTLFLGMVDDSLQAELEKHQNILREELNVHDIKFLSSDQMASWQIKPNFKTLGKKLGAQMKQFQSEVKDISQAQIQSILDGKSITLMGAEFTPEDFLITLAAQDNFDHPCHAQGALVIGLDTQLTPALKAEGLSRELINRVQRFRKECDFDVSDRIKLHVQTNDDLGQAFKQHQSLIEKETLSTFALDNPLKEMFVADDSLDSVQISIGVLKTG